MGPPDRVWSATSNCTARSFVRCCGDQSRNLVATQHTRQFARLRSRFILTIDSALPSVSKKNFKPLVVTLINDRRWRRAGVPVSHHVQSEAPQFLCSGRVRRRRAGRIASPSNMAEPWPLGEPPQRIA
jgi:hypothetical protein